MTLLKWKEQGMPLPEPPAVTSTATERQALEKLVKCHTIVQQITLRTRIGLAAAGGFNNAQIANPRGEKP
jgi:hypothetical protein